MPQLELTRRRSGPAMGFELGDMAVTVDGRRHSSAGRSPDQSMMIYVAICDLIGGRCDLAVGRRQVFEFVGADSSFSLLFEMKNGLVALCCDGAVLGTVPFAAVLDGVANGLDAFLSVQANRLPPSDAVHDDLATAQARLGTVLDQLRGRSRS